MPAALCPTPPCRSLPSCSVELIQDFEFPAACQRIKCTADQQFIFASGYHPPRVRCVLETHAWLWGKNGPLRAAADLGEAPVQRRPQLA